MTAESTDAAFTPAVIAEALRAIADELTQASPAFLRRACLDIGALKRSLASHPRPGLTLGPRGSGPTAAEVLESLVDITNRISDLNLNDRSLEESIRKSIRVLDWLVAGIKPPRYPSAEGAVPEAEGPGDASEEEADGSPTLKEIAEEIRTILLFLIGGEGIVYGTTRPGPTVLPAVNLERRAAIRLNALLARLDPGAAYPGGIAFDWH